MKKTLEQHFFCQKAIGNPYMYNNYVDCLFYECRFPKLLSECSRPVVLTGCIVLTPVANWSGIYGIFSTKEKNKTFGV